MATELPLQSGVGEVIDRVPEVLDCSIEGVELSTLNITAGLSLGLLMGALGDACIRQVLRGGDGPLGERRSEGKR